MAAPERLIVLTRLPRPGLAKTRLIPSLGPEGASGLQRELTRRLLARARRLALARPLEIEVRHADGGPEEVEAWLGEGPTYAPQGGEDLGERLAEAIDGAFAQGAQRVVAVGADVPDLDEAVLSHALDALVHTPLVLGPATDGGYYLVGLARPEPGLFRGVAWGGPLVLDQTLERAAGLGLKPVLLPRLADLDRPEDLAAWRRTAEAEAGRVSVVIPTLLEEGYVGRAVTSALEGGAHEVIVADGGSADATRAEARAAGALVITARTGRGRQMNAAARLAVGDILLFLHADTSLPAGWARETRRLLAAPEVGVGAFGFRLDRRTRALRLIERAVSWRCRLAGLPYGDQALFARASDFWDVGGYPDYPIMEDWELVVRLKKRGRVAVSPLPATTSARRWARLGLLRTTLLNSWVPLLYQLGVSPRRLGRLYYGRALPEAARWRP